jgi:hypothetical protein
MAFLNMGIVMILGIVAGAVMLTSAMLFAGAVALEFLLVAIVVLGCARLPRRQGWYSGHAATLRELGRPPHAVAGARG